MMLAHALSAAGDALTLVAAVVMTALIPQVVIGAACVMFVACGVWVRIGGGR
jgi:hypothetical protein